MITQKLHRATIGDALSGAAQIRLSGCHSGKCYLYETQPEGERWQVVARSILVTGLIIAANMLPGICSTPSPKNKAESPAKQGALILHGKSSQYGATTCGLNSEGISFSGNVGGFIWLVVKPDLVSSLNSEAKTYFEHRLEEGRLRIPRHHILVCDAQLIDKQVLAGQKCSHYFGLRRVLSGEMRKVVEFWSIEKTPLPPEVVAQWCEFFGLPATFGFPIQVQDLPHKQWIHTFALFDMKTAKASAINLKIPPGYKPVKDRAALYFSQNGEPLKPSDIEEIFSQPVR